MINKVGSFFASQITAAVHQYTNSYATLGSASLKWYYIWTPTFAQNAGLPSLQLDFYQTHYYNWMDGQSTTDPALGPAHHFSPLEQAYTSLGDMDRPMIVGEFAVPGKLTGDLLVPMIQNGYAGGLAWSYQAGDGLTIDWPSFEAVAQKYKNITG